MLKYFPVFFSLFVFFLKKLSKKYNSWNTRERGERRKMLVGGVVRKVSVRITPKSNNRSSMNRLLQ